MKVRSLFLILLLLGVVSISFSANRYSVASGNWNSTATWSATSGGAPGASFPASGDNAYIQGGHTVTLSAPAFCTQVSVTSTLNLNDYTLSASQTTNISSGILITGTGIIYGSYFFCSGTSTMYIGSPAGITASGPTGNIQCSFLRSYASTANYIYNGTDAQVSGNGLPATVNNLTINNAAGVTLTNSVTVNGILTQIAGTLNGTTNVDGYSSYPSGFNYINIAESGLNMNGFTVSTNTSGPFGFKIKRQWSIAATNISNKTVTFYWDAADDENFDWGSAVPAVWKGSSKHLVSTYNVSSDPRWATVINLTIDNLNAKDNYTIGRNDDGTVPVELSSFTAVITSENFVAIHWTTQTETNAAGFYIMRNTVNVLNTAIQVSPLIYATNTSQETSYTFVDQEVVPGTYYYWLQNLDLGGGFNYYGPISVTLTQGNGGDTPPVIVNETALMSAYPNPFNPSTNLRYYLKSAGQVKLDIYNCKGQLIRSFDRNHDRSGYYQTAWDGKDMNGSEVSSGIYYYRMTSGKYSAIKKAVLAK